MERKKVMCRIPFQRLKPDNIEFTALLGLVFWNHGLYHVNDQLTAAVEKNRRQILAELNSVYKKRGKIEYAIRLGELFCLLDTMEEHATISINDMEIYRLLNLFSECSEISADHEIYRLSN
ncbi:hypothetical protein PENTCL1PPCAC_7695 [Pristionchus entomophagus]|uniref:NR LBD domain-containing protein n=1 Tax=Pristionchus entomophagus TaxID=358040 RepID=A0AAV5SR58_9BILA|nr:hypothetical protein PENTCL1PPCAC_7695 [Pristionchus entomophagus]